jgi:MFS family permease
MGHAESCTMRKVVYWDLLRTNRNFRAVWLAQVVSEFGDWFNLIASASLVAMLTGSEIALGGLLMVRMLAPFLVSPIGGVLADRCSRKTIMIATDLGRAVVVLGFLLVRSPADVWFLYVLTALQFGLSGLFVPARTAIVPDIVSTEQLGVANALSSATFAVMQAVGAAVGGLVAGAIGMYETFVIDAISFVLSAALCAGITLSLTHAADEKQVLGGFFQQYIDGLRYLRNDLETLAISLHKGMNGLFITGGLNVLSVCIARSYFPVGHEAGISLGLVFCATGVGSALGPIIARRFTRDREQSLRYGLVVCYAVSAAGLALAAPLLSLGMVLVGLVIRGIGGGMLFVFSTQLLMQRARGDVRGRVFGTEFAARTLLNAIGLGLVSVALDRVLSISAMLYLMTGLALVPGVLWLFWLRATQAQQMEAGEQAPPSAG